MHPMGLKLNTKVLGKEFEEEPFFKRVFLNNSRKNSQKNITAIIGLSISKVSR